jgi:hypothetical protein
MRCFGSPERVNEQNAQRYQDSSIALLTGSSGIANQDPCLYVCCNKGKAVKSKNLSDKRLIRSFTIMASGSGDLTFGLPISLFPSEKIPALLPPPGIQY